jgi:DNA-binding response OmpR family regulator
MADSSDTLYPPPLVLIGGLPEPTLARVLQAEGFGVVQVPTGTRVVEWAHDVLPDLILLREDLRDMPALDACESLRRNPRIGHNVPILILTADRPSPGQRVAALSAGAWDFLRYPGDAKELTVKLQSNLQAKRNLALALAEGLVDPMTGLHNRIGLARRARELGALMSRRHGALGCVVFELDTGVPSLEAGGLVARRSTRVSDVVGVLSPKEVAVVAPGTDDAGVVQLALRVGRALSAAVGGDAFVPGSTLRAGYDAVSNVTYAPVDPVELLARASTAVRSGRPESGSSWVCRFASTAGSAQRDTPTSSTTQAVPAAGRIERGA